VDSTVEDGIYICASCGSQLTGDPDEDPTGDNGMPICGNCAREATYFDLDLLDGVLDGHLGLDR